MLPSFMQMELCFVTPSTKLNPYLASIFALKCHLFFIPPRKLCLWWVDCFHVVRASVRNVFFEYLEESLLDFHQTLQTCSYMQDKYFRPKSKGKGPILLVISLCSSKWLLI